jgi:hypothetical protein
MKIRPQIDAFLDYTRGSTKSAEDPNVTFRSDYATDSINAGLEGQLSPTITGSVSAGFAQYNARAGDTVGDSDNFVYNISLAWKPRQGTDVSISGGQQNRIASNAQSLDTTLVRLNVRKRLAASWTASADAEWETFSVRGANSTSDDRVALALILEYSPSDRFGLGGGVRHNIRWSFNPNFDISRTTLNLYGRYTF